VTLIVTSSVESPEEVAHFDEERFALVRGRPVERSRRADSVEDLAGLILDRGVPCPLADQESPMLATQADGAHVNF
jgi:hypothetical protein